MNNDVIDRLFETFIDIRNSRREDITCLKEVFKEQNETIRCLSNNSEQLKQLKADVNDLKKVIEFKNHDSDNKTLKGLKTFESKIDHVKSFQSEINDSLKCLIRQHRNSTSFGNMMLITFAFLILVMSLFFNFNQHQQMNKCNTECNYC